MTGTSDDTPGSAADFSLADEPFALFANWLRDAEASEPNDPNAMALASVDADGLPNVRMVLLKGVDGADATHRGFVFYTNLESAKGRELLAAHKAALVKDLRAAASGLRELRARLENEQEAAALRAGPTRAALVERVHPWMDAVDHRIQGRTRKSPRWS